MRTDRHAERHLSYRSNWLRAAVLGANDGIVSTSSLVLGVAASGAASSAILTAGIAGLVAGALSMAAGEFVSVSSQRDTEQADLRVEERELRTYPEHELEELTGIYEGRGVPRDLAREVAIVLTERDALGAHARDELGLGNDRQARPLQAAGASAVSFSVGAVLPVLSVAISPSGLRIVVCVVATVLGLAGLGALGARLGGANMTRATARVVGWGVLAMGVTAGIGSLVGGVGG
ncbi:MAG: VIT family protein [Actinomycetota bacterium]|nr:VIT family protein [Actinomycetota bacterium]